MPTGIATGTSDAPAFIVVTSSSSSTASGGGFTRGIITLTAALTITHPITTITTILPTATTTSRAMLIRISTEVVRSTVSAVQSAACEARLLSRYDRRNWWRRN